MQKGESIYQIKRGDMTLRVYRFAEATLAAVFELPGSLPDSLPNPGEVKKWLARAGCEPSANVMSGPRGWLLTTNVVRLEALQATELTRLGELLLAPAQ